MHSINQCMHQYILTIFSFINLLTHVPEALYFNDYGLLLRHCGVIVCVR